MIKEFIFFHAAAAVAVFYLFVFVFVFYTFSSACCCYFYYGVLFLNAVLAEWQKRRNTNGKRPEIRKNEGRRNERNSKVK